MLASVATIPLFQLWRLALMARSDSAEIKNLDKYFVFKCECDFINTEICRGGSVCQTVDSFLNPENLQLKKITEFSICYWCTLWM